MPGSARRSAGGLFFLLCCLVPAAASLSGCDRVPDCDGREAERLMQATIFSEVRAAFRSDGNPPIEDLPFPEPESVPMTSRQMQINEAYLPRFSIRSDVQWLKYRIAAQVAQRHRIHPFPLYLMLDNSAILRKGVRIRLSDHEALPDRREGERVFTKVCRAKLWIEPALEDGQEGVPVTLTYSLNAPPTASKLHGANPFYVAVNFFEASEPPLPFELSREEKAMLLGARRDLKAEPAPQDVDTLVVRRTLRALRRYYEQTPVPRNVPYPGT